MFGIAFAMGQGAPPVDGGQGGFMGVVPILLMFGIFYFLLIRPQQKKQKEHREMVAALKAGDKVITSGGLHGVITKCEPETVTLEIAENVSVKVNRANVGVLLKPQAAQPQGKKKDKKKNGK